MRIVLVRPRNPVNIGAAARAMANFGFEDMVVVNPYEPVWRETKSAVGADAVVSKARAVNTLEEAVRDCQLVLGTTAVRTRRLKRTVVRLPELASFLDKSGAQDTSRIALLFGPEKTGLSEEYLEQCNAFVTIPTTSATPSMNLSHSVAVCCYELSKKDFGFPSKDVPLATVENRELLAKHALRLFDAAGYLSQEQPSQKMKRIRQSLIQWNLHRTDVRWLLGMIRNLTRRLNTEK